MGMSGQDPVGMSGAESRWECQGKDPVGNIPWGTPGAGSHGEYWGQARTITCPAQETPGMCFSLPCPYPTHRNIPAGSEGISMKISHPKSPCPTRGASTTPAQPSAASGAVSASRRDISVPWEDPKDFGFLIPSFSQETHTQDLPGTPHSKVFPLASIGLHDSPP